MLGVVVGVGEGVERVGVGGDDEKCGSSGGHWHRTGQW